MRAFRISGTDEASVQDVGTPVPSSGELLLRVGGAGLCHSDVQLMSIAGFLGGSLPFTGGHEIAGWVDRLASDVSGVKEGAAVAVYGLVGCGGCKACAEGKDQLCPAGPQAIGVTRDGGLAEFVVVPARNVIDIGGLDVIQAATMTDAGVTAYSAVVRAVDLLVPGATALVIGIGGLGHLAVQILAALTPARIVAVDVAPDALHLARAVGAHDTVLASDTTLGDLEGLIGARGVDVVFDFVANDATLSLGAHAVKKGGAMCLTGLGHGTLAVGTGFDSPIPPEVRVERTFSGSGSDLIHTIELAKSGRLRATVSRHELDDVPALLDSLKRGGEIKGRAVVVP